MGESRLGGVRADNNATTAVTPSIVADSASMSYRIYEDKRPSLRELVARGFKGREFREIHAVRSVSLKAFPGDAIGVIGRNGSGKSTLLRGLAGLQPVQSGSVFASCEPVLLGVGAALQPAVSARRNVELGLLAMGMPPEDVRTRTSAVVKFAGVEDFIDLPLRAYSSGMRARLHFAIATATAPEILLIDEALAVGDEDFKDTSAKRIDELRRDAGTVFIVSHSMEAIRDMCNRAIWMDEGLVLADGAPNEVIGAYKDFVSRRKQE